MRIKTLLATFVLMAVPGFAYANCSWGTSLETTMSCAEGAIWDETAKACVPTVTS